MRLEINTQLAKVGINRTDALISIESQRPVVEAKYRPPSMDINIEHAKIAVDQTQCFNEIGYKKPDTLAADLAKRFQRDGLNGIAAVAQKGDVLAKVNKNPKAIPDLAKYALRETVDFTVEALPKSRPGVSIDQGTININWDMGHIEFRALLNKPKIHATRASIEVYLLQKPDIEITYRGKAIDITV